MLLLAKITDCYVTQKQQRHTERNLGPKGPPFPPLLTAHQYMAVRSRFDHTRSWQSADENERERLAGCSVHRTRSKQFRDCRVLIYDKRAGQLPFVSPLSEKMVRTLLAGHRERSARKNCIRDPFCQFQMLARLVFSNYRVLLSLCFVVLPLRC